MFDVCQSLSAQVALSTGSNRSLAMAPLLNHVVQTKQKLTSKKEDIKEGKKAVALLLARPKSKAFRAPHWPLEVPIWPYSPGYLKHGKILPGQELVNEATEVRRNYLELQETLKQ